MSSTASFTSTIRDVGMYTPNTPELPPPGGPPFWIELLSQSIQGFHPWLWMYERYLQTTSIKVSGGKNGGKTAIALLMIYYLSMLDNDCRRVRSIYDVMRLDQGRYHEDDALLQSFGSRGTRIDVTKAQINPYDPRAGLNVGDMVRWTVSAIADLAPYFQFNTYQVTILLRALELLLKRDKKLVNPSTLTAAVQSYSTRRYIRNLEGHVARLKQQLPAAYVDEMIEGGQFAVTSDAVHLEQSAARLGDVLAALFSPNGVASGMFGDTGSLVELFGDFDYVSHDLSGLTKTPELASVYHLLSQLVMDRLEHPFDLQVHDETPLNWNHTSWAEAQGNKEWQIRGHNAVQIMLLQEYGQLSAVKPENRNKAEMSLRGAGLHLIGPGQSVEAYEEMQPMLGLTEADVRWLKQLGIKSPGTFGFKPRDRAMLRMYLPIVTDAEKEIIKSNRSLDKRLSKRARAEANLAKEGRWA